MSFHLDYYQKIDPDTLYEPGSTTIIFSHSGEWYESKYPQTHKDMLHDDDIFIDVFGGNPEKDINGYDDDLKDAIRKQNYRTRPAAVLGSILGRYGLIGTNFISSVQPQENEGAVLATWNSEGHPLFRRFIYAFLDKISELGPIEKVKNRIVVTSGHSDWKAKADKDGVIRWEGSAQSRLLAEYLGDSEEDIQRSIDPDFLDNLKKNGNEFKSQYRIGGILYSSVELFDMLKRVHVRASEWPAIKHIWCHPDIDRYPELKTIQPRRCNPTTQKFKPRLTDYVRKSFEIGLPAGIGGTSESTLNFQKFFYEEDFVDHLIFK
jgi:hypothetical protein